MIKLLYLYLKIKFGLTFLVIQTNGALAYALSSVKIWGIRLAIAICRGVRRLLGDYS